MVRAPVSQAGGHRFNSYLAHPFLYPSFFFPVKGFFYTLYNIYIVKKSRVKKVEKFELQQIRE